MGKEKNWFYWLRNNGKANGYEFTKCLILFISSGKNKAAGDFVKTGATSFATSKQLAEESDIVITMLPDSPDVENVVFGDEGVIDGIREGSLFIDMSTIDPSVARKIYTSMIEKGVEALDAPVSDGEKGAEDGAVSIMAGGSKKGFQKALPLFEIMGKNSIHIGNAGAGQLAKACNQIVIGVTMQGDAEDFALARESGVNPEKVREALLGADITHEILN